MKTPMLKSNHRLSIAQIPPTVDIRNPKKGDIIEMENGSRKKFDGVVWRKICSIPDCFIAAQRDELCRKHFIKLNGKPTNLSTNGMLNSISMVPPASKSFSSMSMSSTDDRFGKNRTFLFSFYNNDRKQKYFFLLENLNKNHDESQDYEDQLSTFSGSNSIVFH